MHKSSDEQIQKERLCFLKRFSLQIKVPVTSPPTAPEEAEKLVENPQHKIFIPWPQLHPHLLLETTLEGARDTP